MNKDYIPPLGTIPVDRLLQLLFSDKITLVIERGTFLNIHLNECLYTHPEYRKGNMTLAVNLSLSELQLLYSPIISPDEEVLSIESCNRHNLILDETVSVVFYQIRNVETKEVRDVSINLEMLIPAVETELEKRILPGTRFLAACVGNAAPNASLVVTAKIPANPPGLKENPAFEPVPVAASASALAAQLNVAIYLNGRNYMTYVNSYRDLVLLMIEKGISLSPSEVPSPFGWKKPNS